MRLRTLGWLLFALVAFASHAERVQAKGKVWVRACAGKCDDNSGVYGLVASADDANQTTDARGKACITLHDREPYDHVDVTLQGGDSYESRTLRSVTVVRECIGVPVAFQLASIERRQNERPKAEPQTPSNSYTVNAETAYVIQSPQAPQWPDGSGDGPKVEQPTSLMPWKILAFSVGGLALAGAIVPLALSVSARSSFQNKAGCGTTLPNHGVSGCDELFHDRPAYLITAGGIAGAGAVAIFIGWLIPRYASNLDTYQGSLHCLPYADAGLSCKLSL